jgi:hypothetical protein
MEVTKQLTIHQEDAIHHTRAIVQRETLTSVAAYFESGFDAQVADGLLRKLCNEQVRVKVQNEYRHELQARYQDKLKRLTNNRKREHSWRRNDCAGSSHGGKLRERSTYRKRKPDARGHGERKMTHEQAAKNKPCHVYGPESKHSYDECRTNPKTSAAQTTTTTSARTTPTTMTSANTRVGPTPHKTLLALLSTAMGK